MSACATSSACGTYFCDPHSPWHWREAEERIDLAGGEQLQRGGAGDPLDVA